MRHGETEMNRDGRILGQSDVPLSAFGMIQIGKLCRRMRTYRFDHIYASDLPRARVTAEHLAAACDCPLDIDLRLREQDAGSLQGLTLKEVRQRFPAELDRYEASPETYAPPSGESDAIVMKRVGEFLKFPEEGGPRDLVAAVTHGGVVKCMLRHLLALSYDGASRVDCPLACVNEFQYRDGQWTLVRWGDVSHLTEIY